MELPHYEVSAYGGQNGGPEQWMSRLMPRLVEDETGWWMRFRILLAWRNVPDRRSPWFYQENRLTGDRRATLFFGGSWARPMRHEWLSGGDWDELIVPEEMFSRW